MISAGERMMGYTKNKVRESLVRKKKYKKFADIICASPL